MEDFVPAHHLPVMFFEDRFQLAVEIRLQCMAVRQFVVTHEFLNGGVLFPLRVVHFIATDMQIGIGEDRRQFADHCLCKGIRRLFCRIQHRFQHAPVAFHFIRPRCAHQLGVGNGNCRSVARHVDFRDHANASVGGVAHDLAHLLRGVKLSVAGKLRELWIALRGKAPALIVSQMPVQHVQFCRRHPVNLPLDVVQRNKVARRILNGDPGYRSIFWPVLDKLKQRFHPAQRAKTGVG